MLLLDRYFPDILRATGYFIAAMTELIPMAGAGNEVLSPILTFI